MPPESRTRGGARKCREYTPARGCAPGPVSRHAKCYRAIHPRARNWVTHERTASWERPRRRGKADQRGTAAIIPARSDSDGRFTRLRAGHYTSVTRVASRQGGRPRGADAVSSTTSGTRSPPGIWPANGASADIRRRRSWRGLLEAGRAAGRRLAEPRALLRDCRTGDASHSRGQRAA